jgi:hypothetical protein
MLEKFFDRHGFLCYDSKTIVTTNPGAVALPDVVNGLTVENSGNTNLFWDSDLILPGDFKAVGGNYGERYLGDCTLKWALPVPAPVDPENMATVSVKFYVQQKL